MRVHIGTGCEISWHISNICYRTWEGGRQKHPTFGRWSGMESNFWDGYGFQDRVGQKKRVANAPQQPPRWVPFDIFSSKIVIHFLKRIILFHRMKNNDKAKVILKNNTSKKNSLHFFSKLNIEKPSHHFIFPLWLFAEQYRRVYF